MCLESLPRGNLSHAIRMQQQFPTTQVKRNSKPPRFQPNLLGYLEFHRILSQFQNDKLLCLPYVFSFSQSILNGKFVSTKQIEAFESQPRDRILRDPCGKRVNLPSKISQRLKRAVEAIFCSDNDVVRQIVQSDLSPHTDGSDFRFPHVEDPVNFNLSSCTDRFQQSGLF